ncbi:adenosylmethionine decarboxylase [Propionivibrio soli]|jgi:spermidine synthase/S-adenosylmethionine decarboxylase|uniref:adenosylmethionine decarboxylase n=1 Tax=Propionivibrio soli TaxID=2976531 RepID=UPI0021E79EE4|nr:adenosylmethionine decarboxylase [Propionivibrio soli]
MDGLHLVAELYDCRCAVTRLQSADALRDICLAVCQAPGLTPVGQLFHQFVTQGGPAGATGAVILAESHLAVHTWPELNAVTLDLYVCNFSRDNSAAARRAFEEMIAAFVPGRIERREIRRGACREQALALSERCSSSSK